MINKKRVLVTGANGFIGRVVTDQLLSRSYDVCATVRDAASFNPAARSGSLNIVSVGNLDNGTDWSGSLKGCDTIIHLAGRAHKLETDSADKMAEFRSTNVLGTLNLARQAADSGARRFVFVSSIGVLGTQNERPFSEVDDPDPVQFYAISKLEAEEGLREVSAVTGMELVIVRPPLVYGPDCPGNFRRLLQLVDSGFPLPFGAVHSRRSFVSVWNLSDFLVTCLEKPEAGNNTFLVSDGFDISLTELLRLLAEGMEKKIPLVPVPLKLIYAASALIGKKDLAEKICGNLTVDMSFAANTLKWAPPLTVDEGLRRTGQWYREAKFAGS